ncbi:MAG: cyclodeaminase/cyclohydrolase family protein [Phycisphaerae bacterium]
MTPNENPLFLNVLDFTAAVAAKSPTPGGGSVAGAVGALGTALGHMSLNFTLGKKKYAEHQEYLEHLAQRLNKSREMMERLVVEDMEAFKLYQETSSLPEGPEKAARMDTATAAAVNVPRELCKISLAVLEDFAVMSDGRCNRWLITDLMAGAALLSAVCSMCHYNVMVNTGSMSDKDTARELLQSSQNDVDKAKDLFQTVEKNGAAALGC